jgi:hypothetical protein
MKIALACMTIGWVFWIVGNTCNAQTPPSNLSPGLQEVLKLTKAQMGDDVIVGYINNSGTAFHLTADDMVYLKEQGVSQPVIAALLQAKAAVPAPQPAPAVIVNPTPGPAPQPAPAVVANPAPGPVPQFAPAVVVQQPSPPPQMPPPAAPAAEVNFTYFHDQLAPFGTWVEVGGVPYWRPDRAIQTNPDWRPYYDMGQWVQTDNGLFWQSDYQWGDIPFHYGRWVRDPRMGWLWAPDYEWGPAWVFWRHGEADAAIGWAPLPVGAVFVGGAFMFNGVRVGVDFDFGLGEGVFVFVGYDHFHEGFRRWRGHEWGYHIDRERLHGFYGRSVIRNEFRRDEHGRFVNHGIGREHMARVTHGRMEHAGFEERHPVGDRNKLAAERSEAGHGGVKPGEAGHAGVKPGEAGHAGGGAPAQAPSKVFRPPAPASKPAAPAAKPAAAPSSTKKK